MKTVGFFLRHFGERGTEVSTYSYAHYNETILGNKSILLAFHRDVYEHLFRSCCGVPFQEEVYARFKARFQILHVKDFTEMDDLIRKHKIDVFYEQTHGVQDADWPPYGVPKAARTILHCVFDTSQPHGDVYIPISEELNRKCGTHYPVLPLIVDVAETMEDMRGELGIPKDAIVFGRYGGEWTFDIPFVHAAVVDVALRNPHIYFLFMNTHPFCDGLPNVKFLPKSVDGHTKRKFINTCDATLHARGGGETFGLAIAEFAVCGKPVFACEQRMDSAHVDILGDQIVLYKDREDLIQKLVEFRVGMYDMKDNGYMQYLPEPVMKIFDSFLTPPVHPIVDRASKIAPAGTTCTVGETIVGDDDVRIHPSLDHVYGLVVLDRRNSNRTSVDFFASRILPDGILVVENHALVRYICEKGFEIYEKGQQKISYRKTTGETHGHAPVLGDNLDPLLCGNVA